MTVSVQVQIHVLYCISRYLCPFARRQRRSSSRDIGMLKITDFVVNCVRYQCRYCSCNAEKFSWYCETLNPTPSPPRTVVVVVISVLYTYCSCNAVNLVVMPKNLVGIASFTVSVHLRLYFALFLAIRETPGDYFYYYSFPNLLLSFLVQNPSCFPS